MKSVIRKKKREKKEPYQGSIAMIPKLNTESQRARNNFFKILKGVNSQFRIIYSVKVSIKCEAAIKTFSDLQVLKKKKILSMPPFSRIY